MVSARATPSISVLVGVDLRKAMVKPSSDDDGIVVSVFGQPFEEVLNFGVNVDRRAILVHSPVWAFRIVWLFL